MIVEQAIFGSAQTRTMRGYHLVAKSSGVNDVLAGELTRWAPTTSAMLSDDEAFDSLNCFTALESRMVISRTVYGRPEYSQRGELVTTTQFLILGVDQLKGYGHSPLQFARAAMALGRLRFTTEVIDPLPVISMPPSSSLGATQAPIDSAYELPLLTAVEQLEEGARIALIGFAEPLTALSFILRQLDPETRARMSFCTGLAPSGLRPFRIHFLPDEFDKTQLNCGNSQQLVAIDASGDGIGKATQFQVK